MFTSLLGEQIETCQVLHPKSLCRYVAYRTTLCGPFNSNPCGTLRLCYQGSRNITLHWSHIYHSMALHKVWGVGFRMRIIYAYAVVSRKRIEFQCLELGYIGNAAERRVDMHKICSSKRSNFAQWYWSHCSGSQVSSTNFNDLYFLCVNCFHRERCTRFSIRSS